MKRLHTNGLPARVLDVLETDGGWLTPEGLAHALDANLESVTRALWRLRQRGLTEHRRIELAAAVTRNRTATRGWVGYRPNSMGADGHRSEWRTEWRFITWGEYE